MPASLQIINRYMHYDYVVGAAVTFDADPVTAKTPRTRNYGFVQVPTEEQLTDGDHVMHVIPDRTSTLPVGPTLAEDVGPEVTRMFRSLDFNVVVKKGSIQSVSVPANQAENGEVGLGTNPRIIKLQPIYFRSPNQDAGVRKNDDITMILVHHTASSANIGGTLDTFMHIENQASAHYVISAEATPQAVKIVQETRRSWQAGHDTWWAGNTAVNNISIGIEMSHKAGTPWPKQQIPALIKFLEVLLKAHPSIDRKRVVGHMDVLTDAQHVLTGRDCPGLEFDWPLLEKEGIGLIPRGGAQALDKAYGGFFRVDPKNWLRGGDSDAGRKWGAKPWKTPADAQAAAEKSTSTSVSKSAAKFVGKDFGKVVGAVAGGVVGQFADSVDGTPIKELQTDLRDIGYSVEVTGTYDLKTAMAVKMFQQHFFAGPRRGLVDDRKRGVVDGITAEYIKRVRP